MNRKDIDFGLFASYRKIEISGKKEKRNVISVQSEFQRVSKSLLVNPGRLTAYGHKHDKNKLFRMMS